MRGSFSYAPEHQIYPIFVLSMKQDFQLINTAFNDLDAERVRLLALLQNYSDTALNQVPKEGVWSPLQVLRHIMSSERGSLSYLQKKLSFHPELPKPGLISKLRYWLLRIAIYSPIRFKAPSSVKPTLESFDLDLLQSEWEEISKDMREYLTDLDPKWYNYLVYNHPIAGRITILQMLSFLKHHLLRHKRQIIDRLPK